MYSIRFLQYFKVFLNNLNFFDKASSNNLKIYEMVILILFIYMSPDSKIKLS